MINQVKVVNSKWDFLITVFMLVVFASGCEKDTDPPVDPPDDPKPYMQYGDPYQDIPSLDEMTMYEINLRAFSTSGNIAGVRARLDDIKALGINVIWLMPIHPIGILKSVNSLIA